MKYDPNFKQEEFCNNDASRTASIEKLFPSGMLEVTTSCDGRPWIETERYDDLEDARTAAQEFVDGVPCE